MDDHVEDIELTELSEEHKTKSDQSVNILEEIKEIDNKLRNSDYKTYKKSTYWHQQTAMMDEAKQESFQKELMECLLRIEAILIKIEALSEK